MNLVDWMEKARGHKYIRKYYVKGKAHYEYETPGGKKISVPSRGASAAGGKVEKKPPFPAKEPESKPEAAPPPQPKGPAPKDPVEVAERVAKPAPGKKQTATEKKVVEDTKKLSTVEGIAKEPRADAKAFGLAAQVAALGVDKQDRGAVKKALDTLHDYGTQRGNKKKVLDELKRHLTKARGIAKTMEGRVAADERRTTPVKGREKWSYEHLGNARDIRDAIQDTITAVRESNKSDAQKQKVADRSTKSSISYRKGKLAKHTKLIKEALAGNRISSILFEAAIRDSRTLHEEMRDLHAEMGDQAGRDYHHKMVQTATDAWDQGVKRTGDIGKFKDSLATLVGQRVVKAAPEKKEEAPKAEPEKAKQHKEPNFRGFEGQSFKFDVPGTNMQAEVTKDPKTKSIGRYEQLQMTVRGPSGKVAGVMSLAFEGGKLLPDSLRVASGEIPRAAHKRLGDLAQQGVDKRSNADVKAARQKGAKEGTELVRSMQPDVNDWLQKADDGKPGESLEETSTEELMATHKGLMGRLKARMDPDEAEKLKTRHAAIVAELKKRGKDPMGKGMDYKADEQEDEDKEGDDLQKMDGKMCKACGKKHDPMEKCGIQKSMGLGDWLEKAKGPVSVGKKGGKIYGYDSKGKPIYSPGGESGGGKKSDWGGYNKLGETKSGKVIRQGHGGKGTDRHDADYTEDDHADATRAHRAAQKKADKGSAAHDHHGKMVSYHKERAGKKSTLDWGDYGQAGKGMKKSMPSHEARMGGPKSDALGGSQDGGDWEGKGKTPDSNGGPVKAAGMDSQGNVSGVDPGKQDKLSEDDEEQGEIGKPDKKKPIEKLGKSELYPAPLTPARQREMVAHEVAKLRKSPEMVTIGPQNHPYGYQQTMGADVDSMSKSEGSVDIPSLGIQPGQSAAQAHVLCKSVHQGGCDSKHSAMLTACPECGAGTTQHRIWPNSSEVQVIPTAGPGGLRPAKREPMIRIK